MHIRCEHAVVLQFYSKLHKQAQNTRKVKVTNIKTESNTQSLIFNRFGSTLGNALIALRLSIIAAVCRREFMHCNRNSFVDYECKMVHTHMLARSLTRS